jgi:hypothetical protein
MREIRLSGLEGGVAGNGHPYPYRSRGRSLHTLLDRGRRGETLADDNWG